VVAGRQVLFFPFFDLISPSHIRSFMKNVYTMFDVNEKEVGFAQLSVSH